MTKLFLVIAIMDKYQGTAVEIILTRKLFVFFLQTDVRVGERRHLVFATPSQLNLLAKAKTWYMDATFKVVKSPSTQLFSIHAFVKQDEDIKQLPLAYALMSGKRRRNYKKVLQAILDLLPHEIVIEAAVADFETAL